MRVKKACIVVDLRTGQLVARVPDIVAVLSAAGWKTDVALKEYGGEALKLAKKAAKDGYDLVIGYGGDGTLSAVFNGVLYAGEERIVADIPGGTYNVWAGTIGVPHDPVKAALAIVNSEAHKVDLGHVSLESLTLPDGATHELAKSKKKRKKAERSSTIRHYFLLHVGMGFDALMMAHISRPLKYKLGPYKLGPVAFDLSLLKELPEQHPFPAEIAVLDDSGKALTQWRGDVWEVVVSKFPYFGDSIDIEPEARLDDGLIYATLVTANGPLKTFEQVVSVLVQHKLDEETTRHFKGSHLSVRLPASVAMHIDGSVVKLEDMTGKSEAEALRNVADASKIMLNYRFDVQPAAVNMAIPRAYDGALFTSSSFAKDGSALHQQEAHERPIAEGQHEERPEGIPQDDPHQPLEQCTQKQQGLGIDPEQYYNVKVIGTALDPRKEQAYIVAGSITKQDNDEIQVVAVRINEKTLIYDNAGQKLSISSIINLRENGKLLVKGDKNKYGVISATHVEIAAHAR